MRMKALRIVLGVASLMIWSDYAVKVMLTSTYHLGSKNEIA